MYSVVQFIMFVATPLAVIAAGLLLISKSIRVNTRHVCVKCKYDLQGLTPTTNKCPECGSVLDGLNTELPGELTTTQWKVTLGFALIIPAFVVLAFQLLFLITWAISD